MKRLMIAASVVAVGAAALADVYNVKFTTTTLGAATKKVKGEVTDYWKKATVTISGVYDPAIVGGPKYYFWTGSGKTMKPVQNAVFEITNDTDMDSDINGKNVALNVGLYVGDEKGELVDYLISGAQGKVSAVGADAKVDLVSGSGSFGGTWDNGFPAYGTWSFSKNASATKKGMATYIKDQGKKAGVTIESWDTTETAPASMLTEYKLQAARIATQLEEIFMLAGETNKLSDIVAEQEVTISNLQEKVSQSMAGVLEDLSNPMINNLQEYLQGVTNRQDGLYAEATNMIHELDAALADWTQYDMQVFTNEDLVVTNVVFSDATSNELAEAIEEAKAVVTEKKAALDSAISEYMDEQFTLEFWTALQEAAGNYAAFTNLWWDKVAEAEAQYTFLTNEEAQATATYNGKIDSIKGKFDVVTNSLSESIAELKEALEGLEADRAYLVTNRLVNAQAQIDTYNGVAGYTTWLSELDPPLSYPDDDTAELQIEFRDFTNGLVVAKGEVETAISNVNKEIADVNVDIEELTGILDTVVENGKDDPAKWTGIAKEIAERVKAFYDKRMEKLAERKAVVLARIERFKSEIEEGLTLKISVDDVNKQKETVEKALEKVENAGDELEEAKEELSALVEFVMDPVDTINKFAGALCDLVGMYPYEAGFGAAFEKVYSDWTSVLTDADQNIVGAEVLLAAIEEVIEKRKNQQ